MITQKRLRWLALCDRRETLFVEDEQEKEAYMREKPDYYGLLFKHAASRSLIDSTVIIYVGQSAQVHLGQQEAAG
jgi:hypothetical protein